VVQLDGGNDALNTIVPHAEPELCQAPAAPEDQPERCGQAHRLRRLHPQLRPLDKLPASRQLAAIPGVGYPNPNRSHFRSMAIWQTAASTGGTQRVRLDRPGPRCDAGRQFLAGNDSVPVALRGRRSSAIALSRLDDLGLRDPQSVKQAATLPTSSDELLQFVHAQAVDAFAASTSCWADTPRRTMPNYRTPGWPNGSSWSPRLLKAELRHARFYCAKAATTRTRASSFPTQIC